MIRRLCFTVDVDRDVNESVPGCREAASLRGGVRYTSAEEGSDIILDMLSDIGMSATFFAEARTLQNIDVSFGRNEVAMHGLDHEDLTGELSGVRLSEDDLNAIMGSSAEIIKERTGRAPKGFRAPYMRTNGAVADAVSKAGMRYDSSQYAELKASMHPYDLWNGIKEVPVPETSDADGKRMSAYLWPMHEGKRGSSEYIEMADILEDGVFVIATHSWHIVESRAHGMMGKDRKEKNAEDVRKILTSLLDKGFKPATITELIK